MSKKGKNPKKRGANKSPFYIQKRTDKRGNPYYIDKVGARRSGVDYSIQWGSKGRVSNNTFERGLVQVRKRNISNKGKARLVVDEIQDIERLEGTRAGELSNLAKTGSEGVSYSRMWDMRGVVDSHKNYKFDILKPNGSYFRKYGHSDAMDIVDRFVYQTNKLVDELVEKGVIDSPIIQVAVKFDLIGKVITMDLKNIIGIDNAIWIKKMINENFT